MSFEVNILKNTNIGFLDSGIGGVTVLRECIKLLPNFKYVYYSDSINNPYGDKSKDEIINIVNDIVVKLIDMECYVIVIACNTASCICVDYLRDKYKNISFIAIEPAIKLACDNEKNTNTLIMATKGTIDSDRFHALYDKYNNDNFYLLSCVGLANLIENGKKIELEKYLVDSLSYYKDKVSSIVLGCTHYPLIKDEIRKVLGNVSFYDGSFGVAKQLKRIIIEKEYKNLDEKKILFLDSSCDIIKEKRFFDILEDNYE